MRSLRSCALAVAVTTVVAAGTFALSAAAANAVTCPTVAAGTGTVTPAPAPRVDWGGCNLAGADLMSADLDQADLQGANLSGADFTNANLAGADLFAAGLSAVTWSGATCPDASSASSHDGSCANALAFRVDLQAPRRGTWAEASLKHVIVSFVLFTGARTRVTASIATTIGTAKRVRATLTGPGIKAATGYCAWRPKVKDFWCTITDPRGIKKGKWYSVTVAEKPQSRFRTAPHLGNSPNPEHIRFT
jgi:Pentapeptide repeats (8 copies)